MRYNDHNSDGEMEDDEVLSFSCESSEEENQVDDIETGTKQIKRGRPKKQLTTEEEKNEASIQNCIWKFLFPTYVACSILLIKPSHNIEQTFSIFTHHWTIEIIRSHLNISNFGVKLAGQNKDKRYDPIRRRLVTLFSQCERESNKANHLSQERAKVKNLKCNCNSLKCFNTGKKFRDFFLLFILGKNLITHKRFVLRFKYEIDFITSNGVHVCVPSKLLSFIFEMREVHETMHNYGFTFAVSQLMSMQVKNVTPVKYYEKLIQSAINERERKSYRKEELRKLFQKIFKKIDDITIDRINEIDWLREESAELEAQFEEDNVTDIIGQLKHTTADEELHQKTTKRLYNESINTNEQFPCFDEVNCDKPPEKKKKIYEVGAPSFAKHNYGTVSQDKIGLNVDDERNLHSIFKNRTPIYNNIELYDRRRQQLKILNSCFVSCLCARNAVTNALGWNYKLIPDFRNFVDSNLDILSNFFHLINLKDSPSRSIMNDAKKMKINIENYTQCVNFNLEEDERYFNESNEDDEIITTFKAFYDVPEMFADKSNVLSFAYKSYFNVWRCMGCQNEVSLCSLAINIPPETTIECLTQEQLFKEALKNEIASEKCAFVADKNLIDPGTRHPMQCGVKPSAQQNKPFFNDLVIITLNHLENVRICDIVKTMKLKSFKTMKEENYHLLAVVAFSNVDSGHESDYSRSFWMNHYITFLPTSHFGVLKLDDLIQPETAERVVDDLRIRPAALFYFVKNQSNVEISPVVKNYLKDEKFAEAIDTHKEFLDQMMETEDQPDHEMIQEQQATENIQEANENNFSIHQKSSTNHQTNEEKIEREFFITSFPSFKKPKIDYVLKPLNEDPVRPLLKRNLSEPNKRLKTQVSKKAPIDTEIEKDFPNECEIFQKQVKAINKFYEHFLPSSFEQFNKQKIYYDPQAIQNETAENNVSPPAPSTEIDEQINNIENNAINFQEWSIDEHMSKDEWKELGTNLYNYQLEKMEQDGNRPEEAKDEKEKCRVEGCIFKKVLKNGFCYLHIYIVQIILRRINGKICSIPHCNRRSLVFNKDMLCVKCKQTDEEFRVPLISLNNDSNILHDSVVKQLVFNDLQTRLRPWLLYYLVTKYPEFDIKNLILYGGYTTRQFIERLKIHMCPSSRTTGFEIGIPLNVFANYKNALNYEYYLVLLIQELFGKRSVFNLIAGGIEERVYSESQSALTYLLIYFDNRTVNNSYIDYSDRSMRAVEKKIIGTRRQILDDLFSEFPPLPRFFNFNTSYGFWLRNLQFIIPLSYQEQARAGLGKFKCDFPSCESSFDTKAQIGDHKKKTSHYYCKRLKENGEKCKAEDTNFKSMKNLKNHWLKAHKVPLFKCRCCKQRFNTPAEFDKHRKNVHPEGICRYCNVVVKCKDFPEHRRNEHPEVGASRIDETDDEDEEEQVKIKEQYEDETDVEERIDEYDGQEDFEEV
ncbi:hypothetical protein PVAND_009179 [Polypedilum vanderplanki]|uniref:C2H2-type domain-containing protein n=1 Tax=Polypedilum vanderplanki TaxID=319348 RepID=A0A9J6CCZ3_POLVA|nr:hypothetical protein PVAND_009179 [Polypedilum vanderplanki]